MRHKLLLTTALLATLVVPLAAQAQGTVRGAERGAREGEDAAGPIGAVVGGAVGAAVGTVGGILGVDDRPRFHEYVVEERRPSYRYDREVVVGATLPGEGVTYYEVPDRFQNARQYRYTVVNGHTVLVEPRTHRIVQVID